jgi:hypothetical protein
LPELEFSASLINLIASFLTARQDEDLAGGEFSPARKTAAGVPQVSILAPGLYSLHINNTKY